MMWPQFWKINPHMPDLWENVVLTMPNFFKFFFPLFNLHSTSAVGKFQIDQNWLLHIAKKRLCFKDQTGNSRREIFRIFRAPTLTSTGCFIRYVRAKLLQSFLTLWDPMDCSPPGSSVHNILQTRILEWVAMPLSRVSFQPRGRTRVSCIAGEFFTAEPLGKPFYSIAT